MTSVSEGERVYDVETSVYTVIEVIDKAAADVIAREEVTERGHVIYESKTVAEMNPDYPEDDRVVRLERIDNGRELLWPISRVTDDIEAVVNPEEQ